MGIHTHALSRGYVIISSVILIILWPLVYYASFSPIHLVFSFISINLAYFNLNSFHFTPAYWHFSFTPIHLVIFLLTLWLWNHQIGLSYYGISSKPIFFCFLPPVSHTEDTIPFYVTFITEKKVDTVWSFSLLQHTHTQTHTLFFPLLTMERHDAFIVQKRTLPPSSQSAFSLLCLLIPPSHHFSSSFLCLYLCSLLVFHFSSLPPFFSSAFSTNNFFSSSLHQSLFFPLFLFIFSALPSSFHPCLLLFLSFNLLPFSS